MSETWPDEKWRAAFGTTDRIVYSLPKCLECGAVIEVCDREKHYNWHRKQESRSLRPYSTDKPKCSCPGVRSKYEHQPRCPVRWKKP